MQVRAAGLAYVRSTRAWQLAENQRAPWKSAIFSGGWARGASRSVLAVARRSRASRSRSRYRGAFGMGPMMPDDTVDDMDYSEPVYRSLGLTEPSELTPAVLEAAIPGLKKQKAFGEATSLWA